jgi:hypothetical protein
MFFFNLNNIRMLTKKMIYAILLNKMIYAFLNEEWAKISHFNSKKNS